MGGSAFSSLPEPPYTPRMPPAVYQHVLASCQAALRDLFVCVATPIEGPGKKDFGDIDILVALDRRAVFPTSRNDSVPRTPHELMGIAQRLLGAKYVINRGSSANLAIPWPAGMDQHSVVPPGGCGPGEATAGDGVMKEKYIQVDVTICQDVGQLHWDLYKHAHGDIWNLLGSTIRPFGLTVDEEALWLRIPEIEKFDRKKAKVRLSRDPVEILHFLGMKIDGYWDEPFESVEALFDYTTTCRLFYVREAPDDDAEGGANDVGVMGGEEGRLKLKSNDRRRMKGRPVYRRWINEFIPTLRAQGKFIRSGPSASVEEARATVRDEAFARFFVEAEYKKRLRDWQLERDSQQMKSLLKELVASTMEPQLRACLLSAMKKIIMEGDLSFGFTSLGLRDAAGFYDTQAVRDFVRDKSEEVGRVAWDRQLQRADASMRLRACSKKVEEGMCGKHEQGL